MRCLGRLIQLAIGGGLVVGGSVITIAPFKMREFDDIIFKIGGPVSEYPLSSWEL